MFHRYAELDAFGLWFAFTIQKRSDIKVSATRADEIQEVLIRDLSKERAFALRFTKRTLTSRVNFQC